MCVCVCVFALNMDGIEYMHTGSPSLSWTTFADMHNKFSVAKFLIRGS